MSGEIPLDPEDMDGTKPDSSGEENDLSSETEKSVQDRAKEIWEQIHGSGEFKQSFGGTDGDRIDQILNLIKPLPLAERAELIGELLLRNLKNPDEITFNFGKGYRQTRNEAQQPFSVPINLSWLGNNLLPKIKNFGGIIDTTSCVMIVDQDGCKYGVISSQSTMAKRDSSNRLIQLIGTMIVEVTTIALLNGSFDDISEQNTRENYHILTGAIRQLIVEKLIQNQNEGQISSVAGFSENQFRELAIADSSQPGTYCLSRYISKTDPLIDSLTMEDEARKNRQVFR